MDLFDQSSYAGARFPEPRAFQADAHDRLRAGVREGHRCLMLMAPTGAGKTYLGMRVAHEALQRDRRVIFVCDRSTLILQTSAVADRYGLTAHGVLQANHWRFNLNEHFQIASAQTLARRSWPDADVIIVDEAHTQHSSTVEHIRSTKAVVIGLSATPFSKGLARTYTKLINATTMHDLVELGVLVQMRVLSCTPIDMKGAETTSSGEWTDKAAEQRGNAIIGDVVKEWIQHGEGRKTIVFGSTIDHCESLCRQFNEAGVYAAVFTSHTSDAERAQLLEEYRKPDSALRVLISVEALAKGFDVPDVSCVVDSRPLRKSLSTAIQMWGRGLRQSVETGKADCILLDHSGNILRFREDFERIYFNGLDTLDAGEKLDKAVRQDAADEGERPACPSCSYVPFYRRCMSCGFERVREALVEHQPGEMREITVGKRVMGIDRAHVWAQVASYARSHGNPDTAQGRAAHAFKSIVGDWPPTGWHVERTDPVEITRNVFNHIRSRNIAFAKAREKEVAA